MKIIIILLMLCVQSAFPVDVAPKTLKERLKEYLDLNAKPFSLKCEIVDDSKGVIKLKITNEDERFVQYYGSESSIQEFQEIYKDDTWILGGWDWCGTGKSDHIIKPKESKILNISKNEKLDHYRISALFSVPGSKLSQLVILYQNK